MAVIWILLIVLVLAAAGYVLGPRAARSPRPAATAGELHSLPSYLRLERRAVGARARRCVAAGVWLLLQPLVIETSVAPHDPRRTPSETPARCSLVMTDVRRVADGLDVAVGAGR